MRYRGWVDDSVGKTLATQGGKPDFSIHLEKDKRSSVFLSPQSRAKRERWIS